MNIIGIDIGGTKCAVILGQVEPGTRPSIIGKTTIKTNDYSDPYQMIDRMQQEIVTILSTHQMDIQSVRSIGISCGGPLDSKEGMILSPPNLPGWDNVPIVRLFEEKFNVPTSIQNDANACALAEWKFGAGRGTQNMIFLTFGTGLGAGLILNGKLYSGTNDNAGEVGHIRLENYGPVGYAKAGSFEGFCSGGGIAQLAQMKVSERFQMGEKVSWCAGSSELQSLTAQQVAEAANNGDTLACEIFEICGTYLGKGLSILIDILNPDCIVIGSIFVRSRHLILQSLEKEIDKEALSQSRKVCRIVPAELNEHIGDIASLSVAANQIQLNSYR